jgi:glycosyltransferase involved in cell wall biosynthesis
MLKVLGLSLYGAQAASARYRLMQYAPGLRAAGIELEVHPLLGDDYVRASFNGTGVPARDIIKYYLGRAALLGKQRDYDVAIVNGELFPYLPGMLEARALRVPYIYDLDDAFFIKYRLDRFKSVSFLLKDKFKPIISRAAAVTAGSHYLASHAGVWNSATHWLPTVVDTQRYVSIPRQNDGIFTIGWIGSPSTSTYLPLLSEPLYRLGREGPVRFVVMGGRCAAIPGVEVVIQNWTEADEVNMINTFDVGVMPLFDDEWARGKCAFKLVQYMSCGVPVVASPVGANVEVVSTNTGFFASNSEEWLTSLRRLRECVALRNRMGLAARERIEMCYSLHSALPTMTKVILSAARSRKHWDGYKSVDEGGSSIQQRRF